MAAIFDRGTILIFHDRCSKVTAAALMIRRLENEAKGMLYAD